MRTACLLVPDLPLRAALRANPELRTHPVAVATGPDARAEILAASSEARAAGILPGVAATHARAICPELRVTTASPALDRATRETLLDLALSFSPRAVLAPPAPGLLASEAAVFLDAGGVSSLFRSEAGFAAAIGGRATSLGLPGAVAVASSPGLARIVARQGAVATTTAPGATRPEYPSRVLASGSEATFLAPLPLDLLAPSSRLVQSLSRFGIRQVRDLLRVPPGDLAKRLGSEVLELVARARGEERAAPLPRHTDTSIREALDFEFAIDRLEPLQFALRGVLSRLTQRLALRHLACGPLDVELRLDGGGRDARSVGLSSATNDVRVLLRLISLALDHHPPKAPVEGVSITTVGKKQQINQLDLFRPVGPHPAELDRTLSELESLCGSGRVGRPEVVDDHRPSVFGLTPFSAPAPENARNSARGPDTMSADGSLQGLAVRALRPPIVARVQVERGVPAMIQSAVASGRVVRAAGPWRTTGGWWSEEGRFASDHFDVQVSDGTVLRLCFDWMDKVWHVDAVYD